MKTTTYNASQSGSFLIGGKLPVHRLGFGAMRLTGPNIWGKSQNPQEAKEILHRAVELGINFMDTADSYGPGSSEDIIAETLYPYPKGLVIATKGGLLRPSPEDWVPLGRPEYLMQCVELSLRRLKIDCIDLYQLHAVDPHVSIEESVGALKQLQKQGKIRFIGLSNVSVAEIEKAQKIVEVVSVQNLYNLYNRESEDVLIYCEKHNIGFIPWYPLGNGDLTRSKPELERIAKEKGATSAQIALAWLLKRSKVMLPIPGTASLKHLEENIQAVSVDLTDEEFRQLSSSK
jgi:pyridoxine 4-dehydrogenase